MMEAVLVSASGSLPTNLGLVLNIVCDKAGPLAAGVDKSYRG